MLHPALSRCAVPTALADLPVQGNFRPWAGFSSRPFGPNMLSSKPYSVRLLYNAEANGGNGGLISPCIRAVVVLSFGWSDFSGSQLIHESFKIGGLAPVYSWFSFSSWHLPEESQYLYVLADQGNRWIPFSIDSFMNFIFVNGMKSEISSRPRNAGRALLPPRIAIQDRLFQCEFVLLHVMLFRLQDPADGTWPYWPVLVHR
jgi:hypothetical protein